MQSLSALVPLLTFLLLWAALYKAHAEWRSAYLGAAAVWTVYLVAITELLGRFRSLTLPATLTLWIVAALAALGWAVRTNSHPIRLLRELRRPQLLAFDWVLLGCCAFIAMATAVVSWMAPPSTFDSMTYHMPRVMHWIQDRNLAFYPTANLRQLYLPPGAELIVLHFQLLTGGDRLANFVQWFSMVGTAFGVSLLARELGAKARAQIYSAVFSMTLPMGIMQSASTNTDYVVTFWLVCFVYWMLSLVRTRTAWNTAMAGATLGLAALTKSVTYLFALPFLIWFGILLLRGYRVRSIACWGTIALIFVAINAGTYIRNWRQFGNPLGIMGDSPYSAYAASVSNETFSAPELASNVVRNLSIHMGTPFPAVNTALEHFIVGLHRYIGISADDPRTTFGPSFYVVGIALNEGMDGNLLAFTLIVVCVALAHRVGLGRHWLAYGGCLVLGFLVFCLYLKWQPFNSRLHLPLFALFAPFVGETLSSTHNKWMGNAIALLLVLGALPWLFLTPVRPLIGVQNILNTSRTELYFLGRAPSLQASYVPMARFLAGSSASDCNQLGLDIDFNDWEYPLWTFPAALTHRPMFIEAVKVRNGTQSLSGAFPEFIPCAVVVSNPAPQGFLRIGGSAYYKAFTTPLLSVFLLKR